MHQIPDALQLHIKEN